MPPMRKKAPTIPSRILDTLSAVRILSNPPSTVTPNLERRGITDRGRDGAGPRRPEGHNDADDAGDEEDEPQGSGGGV